tara:strand:+ start:122 stop:424 length:303 start_codon:yes stop_codon:yes gene_type:complete
MPKGLLVLSGCGKFCSLLLSKPVVILRIPALKRLIDQCSVSLAGCNCSRKDRNRLAQKEAFKILSSLDEESKGHLKQLYDEREYKGINVQFESINKNIVI